MTEEEVKQWIAKGKELSVSKSYENALACFDRAIRLNSKAAEAWNEKGSVLLIIGKVSEAADCFNKATMLDPRYIDAWMNRHASLLLTGSYQEAMRCLDEVTRIDPQNEKAWVDKGGLLLNLRKYKEAIACFDKAIQINPQSIAVHKRQEASRHVGGAVAQTMKRVGKKVCLLGDPAVGKTSLIRRYVLDLFEEKYLSTIGAKITKKTMNVRFPDPNPNVVLTLMIWDIAGQDDFRTVQATYYRGAEGALVVCDLTRKDTLTHLDNWVHAIHHVAGSLPVVFLLNKIDLGIQAAFSEDELKAIATTFKAPYYLTSAKSGQGVEDAFNALSRKMLLQKLP